MARLSGAYGYSVWPDSMACRCVPDQLSLLKTSKSSPAHSHDTLSKAFGSNLKRQSLMRSSGVKSYM